MYETCGPVAGTHGDVLNGHTEECWDLLYTQFFHVFSACRITTTTTTTNTNTTPPPQPQNNNTTQHRTQHHTETGTERDRERERREDERGERSDEERKRRKREWFGEHLLHPTLYQALLFAFDQMSSWYRETPEETQLPEENGKAHRGQTKLDQQRIQTSRGGICKADGIAREPQNAEGNIESGLRGNQDSQRGPSERGRNDGQKQEPLFCLRRTRRKSGDSNSKN